MEISWSAGTPSVVVDVRPGALHSVWGYGSPAEAADFHAAHGGSLYYQSQSGLSGAGRVPDRPYLVQAAMLRTDVAKPSLPKGGEIPGMHGIRIIALTEGLRTLDQVLVVDTRHGDKRVYVTWRESATTLIRDILQDVATVATDESTMDLTSWGMHWSTNNRLVKTTIPVAVYVPRGMPRGTPRKWGKTSLRRALELVFWSNLYSKELATAVATSGSGEWWLGLGLGMLKDRDGAARIFRMAGGIAREEIKPFDILTGSPWATFTGDGLRYITLQEGEYRINRMDGWQWVTDATDAWAAMDSKEYVRSIKTEYTGLEAELFAAILADGRERLAAIAQTVGLGDDLSDALEVLIPDAPLDRVVRALEAHQAELARQAPATAGDVDGAECVKVMLYALGWTKPKPVTQPDVLEDWERELLEG